MNHDLSLACWNGCGALVDSGTSLISVPSDVAQRALNVLNSKGNPDCSRLYEMPNLEFSIGGKPYSLPPHAYIGYAYGLVPNVYKKFFPWLRWMKAYRRVKVCSLLLMSIDVSTGLGPLVILGMPFMREYYTTFDRGADDSAARAVWTASHDGQCNAVSARLRSAQRALLAAHSAGAGRKVSRAEGAAGFVRSVDLSRIRLSSWAAEAAEVGHAVL